ncbi:MAG TPA: hypothetical protein VFF64_10075 [Candidatus Eremiobacteraceae bacterium]|nr:hypothetical protein [Candidatus Eremiobacteraceae bacterium]
MVAELPPAIAFMLSEFRGNKLGLSDVRRRLSDESFVRDFLDQCLAGIGTFKYADRLEARVDKFDVYAGHSLNPLSPDGKCRMPGCRVAYAHQFARNACLYADRVVIPDPFSFTVDETTDEEMLVLLVVLKILQPLLEAGIIVFGPAAAWSCSDCAKAIREAEKQVMAQLWRVFKQTKPDVFRYKDGRRWHMSFGSPLFTSAGDELRITVPATREAIAASKPDVVLTGKNAMDLVLHYRKFLRGHFAQCAQGVVFSSHMGGSCNSTVATNTRVEAAGYRLLDRRKVGFAQPDWSLLRTVPLPALERLNALQALQVRKEAEKAMPAFRAMLQRDLMSLENVSDDAEEKRALEVAAELRVAARDLQGQLASLRLPSVRRSENLFVGLAIALEIVALSTGNPTAMLAVSGAFASLMLAAHKSERDRQEKQEAFAHQPAYVLLTAERIHGSRH